MIPRYSRPQMAKIWEPENYFRIQLDIEAYACEAQEELGVIPKGTTKAVRERGAFEVARIRDIEREIHHETIAFLTNLAEHVGPESRFVHQGMTSSDVLDTCFAVQLTEAADMLLADLDAVLAALKKRAFEHKLTPTVGRSHGIHAEPTTFGLKLAGHYAEFARNRGRLVAARKEIATCAISGAVGTFANIDPRVEEYVAKKLGLEPEPISTQIIPRDRHAAFFIALALIAAAIERFIAPDATTTLDFALDRLAGVIDRMIVDPERMAANLDSLGGLVDSQRVLLALTQAGMSREDAYRAVQRNAMAAWDGRGRFSDLLKQDPKIARLLDPDTIDGLFDTAYHLKHVDTIFRRVFGE